MSNINKEEAIKEIAELKLQLARLEAVINVPQSITDLVFDFDSACLVLGESIKEKLEDIKNTPKRLTHIIAELKLEIIIQALNEGWVANWQDKNEYKYFPWLRVGSSGVLLDYCYETRVTTAGSRHCLKSKKLVNHIVMCPAIMGLYEEYLIK